MGIKTLMESGVKQGAEAAVGGDISDQESMTPDTTGQVGEPDGSKVPPEWHAWLHHRGNEVPQPRQRYPWEKPHQPNLTGTPQAYHPPGSVLRGEHRPRATGDYEPWTPG